MSELEELRAALVGEPSSNYSTTSELQRRLREFVGSGQRAEVLSLLDLLSEPLALSDLGGLVSPHASLILSTVRRFHEPDVVELLERAEAGLPISARSQLVRSVFEIAAIKEDEHALLVGIAMAERLVRDNVPITGMDDPLYWLQPLRSCHRTSSRFCRALLRTRPSVITASGFVSLTPPVITARQTSSRHRSSQPVKFVCGPTPLTQCS